jgi:hypothetical protein
MAAQVVIRAPECNSSLDTNCFNPERGIAPPTAAANPVTHILKHG